VVWPPRQQHTHAWQLKKLSDHALVPTAEYRKRVSIREENVRGDEEEADGLCKPGVDDAVVGQVGCDAQGNRQLAAKHVKKCD